MYTYVYIYIYMCTCMFIYNTHIYIYICTHINAHICLYMHIYIYVNVGIHNIYLAFICSIICLHRYRMYVCIHTHTPIDGFPWHGRQPTNPISMVVRMAGGSRVTVAAKRNIFMHARAYLHLGCDCHGM